MWFYNKYQIIPALPILIFYLNFYLQDLRITTTYGRGLTAVNPLQKTILKKAKGSYAKDLI